MIALPSSVGRLQSLLAAVVFAGMVASAGPWLRHTDRWWAVVATGLVALVAGYGVAVLRPVLWPGAVPTVVAGVGLISAACVPETDHLPTLIAVPALLAVVEVVTRRPVELPLTIGATTGVLWGAMFGAVARQSAYAGALFAWWPIALGAVVAWRSGGDRLATVVTIGVAAVAAAIVARTGALGTGPEAASAVSAAAIASAAAVAAVAALSAGRRGSRAGARPRSPSRR